MENGKRARAWNLEKGQIKGFRCHDGEPPDRAATRAGVDVKIEFVAQAADGRVDPGSAHSGTEFCETGIGGRPHQAQQLAEMHGKLLELLTPRFQRSRRPSWLS